MRVARRLGLRITAPLGVGVGRGGVHRPDGRARGDGIG